MSQRSKDHPCDLFKQETMSHILTTCFGLLALGSYVSATPSPTQLGDVQILAADDLISTCSTLTVREATYPILTT